MIEPPRPITFQQRLDFLVARAPRGVAVGFWIFVVLSARGLVGAIARAAAEDWTLASISGFTFVFSGLCAWMLHTARRRVRRQGPPVLDV